MVGGDTPSLPAATETPPRLRSLHRARPSLADVAAAAVFAAVAALYFWRLDAYLINDDEGGYLYAAWRISLGELPYRDFLTPQLPAFLMPGGWLMMATGPDVWAARALGVVLVLAAGVLVWATARRMFGAVVGLLAGAGFLLQPAVYLHCRTFRSESSMLFACALGVYLFARAAFPRPGADTPPDRRGLVLSGLAFGLAMLAKLFGVLPLAGCLAWLGADGFRRRPLRAIIADAIAVGAPCALTVAAGLGAFRLISDQVYAAVFGHHLMQGGQKGALQVLWEGLAFLAGLLRDSNLALVVFVAAATAAVGWTVRERRVLFWAWQLPTVLAFLLLSREKFPRHLLYLAPALTTLYAVAVWRLGHARGDGALWLGATMAPPEAGAGDRASGARMDTPRSGRAGIPVPAPRWGAWLAGAMVLSLAVPWALLDHDYGFRWETGTWRLADFITLATSPDEIVLSDYSELNFYGRRPTTYAAASLSAGAAASGQITWARLERELDGRVPPLLVLDTAAEFAHLRFLRDRAAFERWVAERYGAPAGVFLRDHQRFEVFAPRGRPLAALARFAGGPTLIAAGLDRADAAPGERVTLRSAWRAPRVGEAVGSTGAGPAGAGPINDDLSMTLRLVDADGLTWAQADDGLFAADFVSEQRVRPTGGWLTGEITADRLALTIPPGTPQGEYDVILGLYGARQPSGLAVVDAGGAPLGEGARVGTIRIRPWLGAAAEVPAAALDLDLRRADEEGAAGLRLLGRGPLPPRPVVAGDVLPVDLWWQVVAREPSRSARLTLDPVGGGPRAADWRVDVPGTGEAATGAVSPPVSPGPGTAAITRQRVGVPVRVDAAGGDYRLRVAVVDADGRPVVGSSGPMADGPAIGLAGEGGLGIGTVRVAPRDWSRLVLTPPPVRHRRNAAVGELAEIVGLDTALQAAPGATLEVTLAWRALAPSAVPYNVSVQLLGSEGRPVAQHDGQPAGGARPTTGWVPGEIVVDTHRIVLPADLAPGTYRLVAAVYLPVSGRRLPVTGADGDGDMVRLGEVDVR